MAQSELNIPITLRLRRETADKLQKTFQDVSLVEGLEMRARNFFEDWCGGGLLLRPDDVASVEKTSGQAVRTAGDVVAAAQARAKRKNGQHVVEALIDPAWIEPLEERAKECGRTVEEFFADMIEIAMQNNWAYSVSPAHPPVYLSPECYQRLRDLTGSDRPSSEEIFAVLPKPKPRKEAAA